MKPDLLNADEVTAWQARLEALRARYRALGGAPDIEGAPAVYDHLAFAFERLEQMLAALARIASAPLAEAKHADLMVLCDVLAPRLAAYADDKRVVSAENLLLAASKALESDLPRFTDAVDAMEEMINAEADLDESQAKLALQMAEHADAAARVLEVLDRLDTAEPSADLLPILEAMVARAEVLDDLDTPESGPARRTSELIVRRAARLLEKTRAALGELPD